MGAWKCHATRVKQGFIRDACEQSSLPTVIWKGHVKETKRQLGTDQDIRAPKFESLWNVPIVPLGKNKKGETRKKKKNMFHSWFKSPVKDQWHQIVLSRRRNHPETCLTKDWYTAGTRGLTWSSIFDVIRIFAISYNMIWTQKSLLYWMLSYNTNFIYQNFKKLASGVLIPVQHRPDSTTGNFYRRPWETDVTFAFYSSLSVEGYTSLIPNKNHDRSRAWKLVLISSVCNSENQHKPVRCFHHQQCWNMEYGREDIDVIASYLLPKDSGVNE